MSFRPNWDELEAAPPPPPTGWRDPYAPIFQPIQDAVGYGDPLAQIQAGQDAYAQGVPAPTPEKKGEAVAQDLVDLQHSGLGQAVGGAVDALLPFSNRYRYRAR
jgi:hypothetical protein